MAATPLSPNVTLDCSIKLCFDTLACNMKESLRPARMMSTTAYADAKASTGNGIKKVLNDDPEEAGRAAAANSCLCNSETCAKASLDRTRLRSSLLSSERFLKQIAN